MNKCFCDKCDKELKTDSDKNTIQFFDYTGYLPSDEPYVEKDVCLDCARIILNIFRKK